MTVENLYIASHTLYLKSLIPLMLADLNDGRVPYLIMKNERESFTSVIARRPTRVDVVNYEALNYVATLLNLNISQKILLEKVIFISIVDSFRLSFRNIFVTTKDQNRKILNFMRSKFTWVISYQHFPFIYERDGKRSFREYKSLVNRFMSTELANRHRFSKFTTSSLLPFGFSFLKSDFILEHPIIDIQLERKALIFHPGGWRNCITPYGSGRQETSEKHKQKLVPLVLKLIDEGFDVQIKQHPLPAPWHDANSLEEFFLEFIETGYLCENKKLSFQGPVSNLHNESTELFALGFGSSGIYEYWSLGKSNYYIYIGEEMDRINNFDFDLEDKIKSPTEIRSKVNSGCNKRSFYSEIYYLINNVETLSSTMEILNK